MEASAILKKYDLRPTSVRIDVLEVFVHNPHALSEKDLEEVLSDRCNRVTIYRTLKSFLDRGIIHKVLDDNNIVKYAVCTETCTNHVHDHEHVHFKCEKCGHTICLENIPLQEVKLPSGYSRHESNMLVLGTCKACNQ